MVTVRNCDKSRMFTELALLTLVTILLVQPGDSAKGQALANEKCTVAGSVLSASTGQPLDGAMVTLNRIGRSRESLSVVTDSAGQFKVDSVDPGRYFLSADHSGYVRMEYGQRDHGDPAKLLTLLPGQSVNDISFELLPGAVITGHVYDETSESIERAQVLAMRYRYIDGLRRLLPAGFAVTDDRGEYRIYDLPPGKYYISASKNPPGPGGSVAYGPSFYPGVADASQASPIRLRAGNDFPDVNLTLQFVTTFHVRGRIVAGQGDLSLTNAFVQLVPSGGDSESFRMGGRVKDALGDFDISGVRPGSYFLAARLNIRDKLLQARVPVTITDSDVDNIRLSFASGATLRGTVQTEGSISLSYVRISLVPLGGGLVGAYSSPVANPDGTLEFNGLPNGRYLLRAFGLPQGVYVKSATLGGQDVLDSGFEIANGEAPGSTLNLVLSAEGGQLGGTVMLDGKPLADATVTLIPADLSKLNSVWWFKSSTSAGNGNFELAGVRPGDYRLIAWQRIDSDDEHDPGFIDQFKDDGEEVQVAPGAMLNLQLHAIPSGKILSAEGQ